jgi:hypothetical protein
MKLFHLSQNVNKGYDTYSDAVVAAVDEESAKKIHPGNYTWEIDYGTWAKSPDEVMATYIGEAVPDIESGVICSSFHAG